MLYRYVCVYRCMMQAFKFPRRFLPNTFFRRDWTCIIFRLRYTILLYSIFLRPFILKIFIGIFYL